MVIFKNAEAMHDVMKGRKKEDQATQKDCRSARKGPLAEKSLPDTPPRMKLGR
jgi:hypothetical protein